MSTYRPPPLLSTRHATVLLIAGLLTTGCSSREPTQAPAPCLECSDLRSELEASREAHDALQARTREIEGLRTFENRLMDRRDAIDRALAPCLAPNNDNLLITTQKETASTLARVVYRSATRPDPGPDGLQLDPVDPSTDQCLREAFATDESLLGSWPVELPPRAELRFSWPGALTAGGPYAHSGELPTP